MSFPLSFKMHALDLHNICIQFSNHRVTFNKNHQLLCNNECFFKTKKKTSKNSKETFDVQMLLYHKSIVSRLFHAPWNPSFKATPFAPEKWPFKRDGLTSGVEINTSMFRFTLSIGLSRGGGLSKGVPLYLVRIKLTPITHMGRHSLVSCLCTWCVCVHWIHSS